MRKERRSATREGCICVFDQNPHGRYGHMFAAMSTQGSGQVCFPLAPEILKFKSISRFGRICLDISRNLHRQTSTESSKQPQPFSSFLTSGQKLRCPKFRSVFQKCRVVDWPTRHTKGLTEPVKAESHFPSCPRQEVQTRNT